jgi:dihydroorotate dehydrogenase electron transfer subunit
MLQNKFIEDGLITANHQLTHDTWELILESPKIAATVKAGQFVMITCGKDRTDPLLRRPFSVSEVINDTKVSLLYKVVGIGTELMLGMRPGQTASLLGPLGTGFKVADTQNHILVGGGIGMAPLLILSKLIKSQSSGNIITLQGGRSSRDMLVLDRFEPFGEVHVSTDDGTQGHHGFVTELMQTFDFEDAAVYCCGPTPMMKATDKIARAKGWPCQVSVEIEMACGMGACLGCSIPRVGEHEGVHKYLHACKDGPVLNPEEIWA